MQRFLTSYAPLFVVLLLAPSVWATEPDRYGQPPTPVLEGGAWWQAANLQTPDALEGQVGHFVMVKGRVLDVFKTREDLYLNFGENYKTDFTVRIPKRAWKQFGDLKGHEITVRGVLRHYNGPMIVADRKEQIHADEN